MSRCAGCEAAREDVATLPGKEQLVEIVSMLMGLIKSLSSRVGEEPGEYSIINRESESKSKRQSKETV
jgi:hypothetical protein